MINSEIENLNQYFNNNIWDPLKIYSKTIASHCTQRKYLHILVHLLQCWLIFFRNNHANANWILILLLQFVKVISIYKFTCDSYRESYIGSTRKQAKIRFCQHLAISPRSDNPVTVPQHSAPRDHCDSNSHPFKFNNSTIIDSAATESCRPLNFWIPVYIQMSPFSKFRPIINSYPLFLIA